MDPSPYYCSYSFSVDLSSCSENDVEDTDDSENARDFRYALLLFLYKLLTKKFLIVFV